MPPQIDPKAYETNFRVPNQVAQAAQLGGGAINPGIMYGLHNAAQGASSGIPYMLANFMGQYPFFQAQFPETAKKINPYLPNNFASYAPYGAAATNFLDAYALKNAGYSALAGSSGLQGISQVLRAPDFQYNKAADYAQTGGDVLGLVGAAQNFRRDPAFAVARGVAPAKNLLKTAGFELSSGASAALDGIGGAASIASGIASFRQNPLLGGVQVARGAVDLYSAAQGLGITGAQTGAQAGASAAKAGAGAASAGAQASSSMAGAALQGVADVLPYAGAALGAYNIGKTLASDEAPEDERALSAIKQAQNITADFFTFGLASLTDAALNKYAPGIAKPVNKVRDLSIRIGMPGTMELLSGAMKLTGSKKGKHQVDRDQYRKFARENKILSEDYKGTLADGSIFDFGADGSKLQWDDVNKEKGAGDAFAIGDAMTAALGLTGKRREAVNLMFSKAALSNADGNMEVVKNNFRHFAKQHGLSGSSIQEAIDAQHERGDISDKQYLVWSNKNKEVFGGTGGKRPLKDNSTEEAKERNKQIGAEVLGINLGTKEPPKPKNTIEDYIKRNGIKPGQSFRIPGNPNIITLGEDGKVTATRMGFDESKVDYNKGPEILDPSKMNSQDIKTFEGAKIPLNLRNSKILNWGLR